MDVSSKQEVTLRIETDNIGEDKGYDLNRVNIDWSRKQDSIELTAFKDTIRLTVETSRPDRFGKDVSIKVDHTEGIKDALRSFSDDLTILSKILLNVGEEEKEIGH